jgi:hypothetical protein
MTALYTSPKDDYRLCYDDKAHFKYTIERRSALTGEWVVVYHGTTERSALLLWTKLIAALKRDANGGKDDETLRDSEDI